jgi:hypothetical protein
LEVLGLDLCDRIGDRGRVGGLAELGGDLGDRGRIDDREPVLAGDRLGRLGEMDLVSSFMEWMFS